MDHTEILKLANKIGTPASNARATQHARFAHQELFSRRWGVLELDRGVVIYDNNPFAWDTGGAARACQLQAARKGVPAGARVGVGVYPTDGESAGYTVALTIDAPNMDAGTIEKLYLAAVGRTLDQVTSGEARAEAELLVKMHKHK